MVSDAHRIGENDIAIVGMAAHLPGAPDIHAYWRNLRDGVSSIRRYTEDELREAGEDPGLLRHRDYVPFGAPLDAPLDITTHVSVACYSNRALADFLIPIVREEVERHLGC